MEDVMKRRHIGMLLAVAVLLVVLFACAAGMAPEGWKRVQFVIPGCG